MYVKLIGLRQIYCVIILDIWGRIILLVALIISLIADLSCRFIGHILDIDVKQILTTNRHSRHNIILWNSILYNSCLCLSNFSQITLCKTLQIEEIMLYLELNS